ncbi:MAG: M56 family metallopeptidase [Nannocystaceae bacterium]|nr:transglycosylase SLT domain-containing protein [bacterium]
MSVTLARALLAFLVQGALLGLVVLGARPWLRRLEASARFAVLFAALLSAPVLVVLSLLRAPGGVGIPGPPPRWADLVAHGWLLGVCLSGLRTTLGLRGLHRLRATGLPLRSLHGRIAALSARLGLGRVVSIVESPAVASPMVIGWWRPMIVLPLGLATGMPADWLDTILAHELAHVRRHDLALRLLQRAVENLLFFHPVVWWLSAQIDHAREEACDDLVVDRLNAPLLYARAITELEAMRTAPAALAAGATEGHLMTRIRHIVQRSQSPRPSHRWWQALVLATTMSVTGYALAHAAESAAETAASVDIAWMPESVVDFEPEIIAAAERHGVDPDLLAIVVLVESRGNPTAKSPRGARGLMQLMPETSDQIARARGLEGHDHDRLDDPTYNLDLGAWYLARQLDRFSDDVDSEEDAVLWAAAAYNGGPTSATKAFEGKSELSEETARYQEVVGTMWSERHAERSSLLKR